MSRIEAPRRVSKSSWRTLRARPVLRLPRIVSYRLLALDALTRIEMQGLVERVWREQGFTAVLVTHDVSEALSLGDRVVMIEDGAITLDIDVPLPRPRRRGSVDFASLEEQILRRLLRSDTPAPDYVI